MRNIPNFNVEQSATLLTNLGYQFISPSECSLAMFGRMSLVILPNVLPLSNSAIDKNK
ncbi:hypothetical protein Vspart_03379 [Vibrio spartinae]|uniref:Uncharacterized protein n=1 Tax=Vibrio spartinae TaxID=1918945 RepID=A0ABX6R511_9VIBR|nr:hypothetical protein Vspart_03379 [Vibrio spartinae]